MPEADLKKLLPAYVSYKAETRFLEGLRDHALPAQIDRGVLTGMSGSVQSAMLKSLESLGLIAGDGKPTQRMKELLKHAAGSAEHKAQLRSLLESAYPYLFDGKIDLKTSTTNQVQAVFREQGVSGSTISKCIAFFLSAAKDAGVEISKYVRTPPMAEVGVKKRNTSGRVSVQDLDEVEEGDIIDLNSGLDLHPALMGVLETLPAPGQPMTPQARELFMRAFDAVLSLAHPVDDMASPPTGRVRK
jgi:hypothetical protein